LLKGEFQYKDAEDKADYVLLANAMINLFHDKSLPDYQRKYVYGHLAEQYKQFDKKPPEFNEEPKKEQEEITPETTELNIDEESIKNIINTVVESIKG